MRINTRFAVAVHIMALTALNHESATTSELLAKSVGTNPVVIRRVIAQLKRGGLLSVRAGVAGADLSRAPEEITLLDIYNAVKTSDGAALFDVHKFPNPRCFVGANIHYVLTEPLADAQRALEDRLASYALTDVIRPIAERSGRAI
jgi:DNA-binding IscR family transcriptional regulator